MTADEIASEVFNEQGYLVLASFKPYKVGDSIPSPYTHLRKSDRLLVALRVTEDSNVSEFMKQARLAQTLSGGPVIGDPDFPYYYRTEPQD